MKDVFTRRSVLKGALLGSTYLAAISLIGSQAFGQTEEPRRGGILKLSFRNIPANFDPLAGLGSSPISILGACYSSLVRFDPQDPAKIIGDLALDWQESEDGLSYTFNLREGVKFHDGTPFTSADAKTSFDWIRHPPEGVTSLRASALWMVESIDAPDDFTVVFNLSQRSHSFIQTMATAWMLVMPKHILESEGPLVDKIIGTGPFKFREQVSGVSFEIERNPDYYDPERPYLDGIIWYVVPNEATATEYFRTGQLDMYQEPQVQVMKVIETEMADFATLLKVSSLGADSFTLNTTAAPLDDVRVRQALSYAMDRDELISIIQGDNATVGGLTPPGQWTLPKEDLVKMPGYGPDKEANRQEAIRLLAEAGHSSGLTLPIMIRQSAGTQEQNAIVFKEQMAKVGVTINIEALDSAAYLDALAQRNFVIAARNIASLIDDPDASLGDYVTCNGAYSPNYCDTTIDDMFARQSTAKNADDRRALAREIELKALNDAPFLVLFWKIKAQGVRNNVHNFVLHPEGDNNRRYDDIWLSEA